VEGPSDELIVQHAYLDAHGKLRTRDGIDVSVRLSFKRFLELAVPLQRRTAVITDNDGFDPAEVMATRIGGFLGHDFIAAHVGKSAEGRSQELAKTTRRGSCSRACPPGRVSARRADRVSGGRNGGGTGSGMRRTRICRTGG
jgi:hypothetical protein